MAGYTSRRNSDGSSPSLDAGLGLIYRLNALWSQVDYKALAGDREGWNFILDRIYINLLYKEDLEVEVGDDGKTITNFRMSDQDSQIYNIFKRRLARIALNQTMALRMKNRREGKMQYMIWVQKEYDTLMLKDAWLRKFMRKLKLYLRESEFNAANAIMGG